MRISLAVTTLVAAALSAGLAQAQGGPDRTSATYQDWVMECRPAPVADGADEKAKAEAAGQKLCEIVQTFTNKQTNKTFAQVFIGRKAGEKKEMVALLQVPVDALLAEKVTYANAAGTVMEAPMTRCFAQNCYGEVVIDDKALGALKETQDLSVSYTLAGGKRLKLDMSVKGLADALTALDKK
ncbi:MAG TPA: invasion associated locus B family protein [Kaistiaceae bacterium]|nr:invasion associated locus B family protein [Kaistiaceae bacterium]